MFRANHGLDSCAAVARAPHAWEQPRKFHHASCMLGPRLAFLIHAERPSRSGGLPHQQQEQQQRQQRRYMPRARSPAGHGADEASAQPHQRSDTAAVAAGSGAARPARRRWRPRATWRNAWGCQNRKRRGKPAGCDRTSSRSRGSTLHPVTSPISHAEYQRGNPRAADELRALRMHMSSGGACTPLTAKLPKWHGGTAHSGVHRRIQLHEVCA